MPIYALEYSVSKDEYRIQPWDMMLQFNNDEIIQGRETGFVLIAIAMTHKEARKLSEDHARLLSKRLKPTG